MKHELVFILVMALTYLISGCGYYTESVSITDENIEEYFDVLDCAGFQHNDFDEADFWGGYKIYRLKSEFEKDIVKEKSDIKIETDIRYKGKELQIDFANEVWDTGNSVPDRAALSRGEIHKLCYGNPGNYVGQEDMYYIIVGNLISQYGERKGLSDLFSYPESYFDSYSLRCVEGTLTLKKSK
ncbi:hypothetical protein [Butyrivibrio fibrisolvens]|uniref:hypothetical protein n=1 Tax=Butyrivibrio fibrisolvens TaxID=831 RepID=UPI0003B536C9|nr:hypothetical protein [Butyrivibrio fibrisolvens]